VNWYYREFKIILTSKINYITKNKRTGYSSPLLEDVLKERGCCKKAHKAYAEICRKQHLVSE
jgi:hypothetical protein